MFENYTGEKPGQFFDPNFGEYLSIQGHSGSYMDWSTGKRMLGAQPAYSNPAQQTAYAESVRTGQFDIPAIEGTPFESIASAGQRETEVIRSSPIGFPTLTETVIIDTERPPTAKPLLGVTLGAALLWFLWG